MLKATMAVKINPNISDRVKEFCIGHGIKYGFFVEKALQERLEREELKEDLLDMKILREEEKSAVPFEEYLKARNV